MLTSLRLWWHRRSVRRKMDRVFGRGADPYRYADSPYERARLAAMRAALGERRYRHALEVGSAEGAFTRLLAGAAERVTGLELSPVAAVRARAALAGRAGVTIVEADLRAWEPPGSFDALIFGDVLYYMDKPLVRDQFETVFPRAAGWVEPGGIVLLAHGFAGEAERALRRGYRERFERAGLKLVDERVIGAAKSDADVCCLLSLLTKP